MKHLYFIPLLLVGLCSCATDEPASGPGCLELSVKVSSDVKVQSRGSQELCDSMEVTISNSHGVIRRYNTLSQVPHEGIWLLSDHYTAQAVTGDSVPASWESRYFKGGQSFDITAGCHENVTIDCRIANVAVSVNYDPKVDINNPKLVVSSPSGSLEWGKDEHRRGYFMLPYAGAPLNYTLGYIDANGAQKELSGSIADPQPATEYVIKVKASPTPSGSASGLMIVVDSHMIEIADQMVLSLPPEILGSEFDINQPLTGNKGSFGPRFVMISACSGITSATMESTETGMVNLLDSKDSRVLAVYNQDPEKGTSTMLVMIDGSLLNSLEKGMHRFLFSITDSQELTAKHELVVIVSEAPVIINTPNPEDIWATQAQVSATLIDASAGEVTFNYRPKGVSEFKHQKGEISGAKATATLSGLNPGQEYELTVSAGTYTTPSITFTTESAPQLPNAGFENWQTSSTPFLLYGSGDEMFWDSGNKGSSMLKKNVTTPDEAVRHSGTYSAKLSSQFVGIGTIGKFAAGNLFVGQYLATQGTDGVLGWGRPWPSRPKALKGYVKYRPGTIEYGNADCPDPTLAKGNQDQAIIYVAILDDSKQSFNDVQFPVIIKTKASERQLFNPSGSNVIAYGQKVFTSATVGEEMIEFNIPLEYASMGRKACNIMIVAAASRGGDYFVGGNSTMWLDDLELVY